MSPHPAEARARGRPETRAVSPTPARGLPARPPPPPPAPRRGPAYPPGGLKRQRTCSPLSGRRPGGEERGAGVRAPCPLTLSLPPPPTEATGDFFFFFFFPASGLAPGLPCSWPPCRRLPGALPAPGLRRAGTEPAAELGSQVAVPLPPGFRLRLPSRDEEAGRATRVLRAQGLPAHPPRNSGRPSQASAGCGEQRRGGRGLRWPPAPEAEGARRLLVEVG